MNKYVILCDTETITNGTPTHVYVWSDSVPTECPNDSLHTINTSTITVIETKDIEKKITLVSEEISTDQTSNKRIAAGAFPGTTYAKSKIISKMDSDITSYDITLFDKDNKQTLLTANLTNSGESVQDLGELTNLSGSPFQMEVFVKKNGGGKKSKVTLQNLIISYN